MANAETFLRRRLARLMENSMNPITRFGLVAGFALTLSTTPASAQLVNPTVSDANANAAGGTNALLSVVGSGTCGTAAGCANTAFGSSALFNNQIGSNNTAMGVNALLNTTGDDNTAAGFQALKLNFTGSGNTATGLNVLFSNTTGNNNTAIGSDALFSNGTGSLNTATGSQALHGNQTGANNTAVGAKALKKSTGTKNIGIGYQAGASLTSGNNNIYIGNQGAGDESQTIRIGTAQLQTFVAGIAGVNVNNAEVVAVDATTGQLGVVQLSSERYKESIATMGTASENLLGLRPVTFAYKEDAQHVKHYGLIAEEVAAVYPELVTRTATGEVRSVRYQELIPMLINELQRQGQALQRQQQELAALRALVDQSREKVAISAR